MKIKPIIWVIILLFISSNSISNSIEINHEDKTILNNDKIANVLIYTGAGAWETGYKAFEKFLDYKNLTWYECDHNYIINNNLVGKFDIIHFPGGSSGDYDQLINFNGMQNIRNFVSNGGGYLGICAGGYFAADKIIWEGNTYDSPLNLFSGTAYGPIDEIISWPGYKMTTISINKSNPINVYEPDSESILYYGGAAFYPDEDQKMDIIGTYDSYNNNPAIINFQYGNGRVLLFGPHPEIEEDSGRDGDLYFDSLNDLGTDWNLLWTSMDWLMNISITKPPAISLPPAKPFIIGPLSGEVGILYNYTITTTDPEEDEVSYYIDWGDGTSGGWTRLIPSGEKYNTSHRWDSQGAYVLRVKAKDENDIESEWSTIEINMPKKTSTRFSKFNNITIEFKGGFGITIIIKNNGNEDINANMILTMDAFFLLSSWETSTSSDIPGGGVETIRMGTFGFGKINVIVTIFDYIATARGYIIGPFVLLNNI